MVTKNIEVGSYNLHLIKTDKFKSLFFEIIITKKLKKEDITITNLLIDNMSFSTKKYNTLRLMNIKKQDLYNAFFLASNKRLGKAMQTKLTFSMLNPKYTEESMLEESIEFLKEIIYNPNIEQDAFNETIFNRIKEENIIDIKGSLTNPKYYASQRLKELMNKKEVISYKQAGYLEDIEKITSKDLYEYYKKFFKNANIDFYVVGDFNQKEIESIITKNFKFNNANKSLLDIKYNYQNKRESCQEVIEQSSFNQSVFATNYNLKNLTQKEKNYTMILYNIILGNSPESRLFKNIREKKSFAYSINSSYKYSDNTLIIFAGINSKNYEDVKISINEEIENLKENLIEEKELENAKQLFISTLKETEEYPSSIIDFNYNKKYFKSKNIDNQIKIIEKITREEILKVAKKITLDTIYLLKEGENETNTNQ